MKIGRNDPCHCGSGKKYKHCCYEKDNEIPEDRVVVPAPDESSHESGKESADGPDSDGEQKRSSKSREDREKGRDRFRGGGKGKSSSFNPRTFRGSQRGN